MNEKPGFGAVAGSAVLVLLSALLVVPADVGAQERDYLLGVPHGSFALRGGFALPRAGSDVFDEITNDFTLSRSDFASFSGAADLSVRVAPRFDLVASGGYMRSAPQSEYRDFIGNDDLPIAQETRLTRVPLTLSVKGYLSDRGESFGRFAWVPAQWLPYVGVGAGAMWYRFEQEGEFIAIPETDPDCEGEDSCFIFRDRITSDGFTGMWHVFGGVEYSLGPRFALTGEARYGFASADLGREYDGFEPIDLSGLQTMIGINIRF